MYEVLPNNQIMKITEIISDKQPNGKAVIKDPFGMLEKVLIIPDRTNIVVDEVININLQWQLFDLQQGQHLDDSTNIKPFKINITGEIYEIAPVDGAATIQFSSSIAKEFTIKTENPDVDNTEIKVVVTDATS